MKTLTLTDLEYEILVRAVESINDIEEDQLFDNCNALYPTSDAPTVLTVDSARELRKELEMIMNRREARHSLCRKVGVNVTPEGYTAA